MFAAVENQSRQRKGHFQVGGLQLGSFCCIESRLSSCQGNFLEKNKCRKKLENGGVAKLKGGQCRDFRKYCETQAKLI